MFFSISAPFAFSAGHVMVFEETRLWAEKRLRCSRRGARFVLFGVFGFLGARLLRREGLDIGIFEKNSRCRDVLFVAAREKLPFCAGMM